MYNKTVLEGEIQEIEYITNDDGVVIVNGTILSLKKSQNTSCVLYFSFYGKLAKKYHKKLFKNTKVLLEGQLEFKQWSESNGTQRARYILNVEKLKLTDQIEDEKFSILYSSIDNSFKKKVI